MQIIVRADIFFRIIAALCTSCISSCGGGGGSDTTANAPAVPNRAPTSASATIVTDMGVRSRAVTPVVADPDSADQFSFILVTTPAHGDVALVANQFSYLPAAAFSGTDSFTFLATDSGGLSVTGTANVTVNNHAPSATQAIITIDNGVASELVSPDISDPDTGDIHTLSIVTPPVYGVAGVVENRLIYRANNLFITQDSFTYRATDAAGMSVVGTATVGLRNHAPIATRARFAVSVTGAGNGGRPFVADADPWDTFSVTATSTPAKGAVTVVDNQFYYRAQVDPDTNTPLYNGPDSFTYRVTDSAGHSINGTALLKVYNTPKLRNCLDASTINSDGTLGTRITAGPCAIYGEITTRYDINGSPVMVKYMSLRPADGGKPRALVFLIGGGDFNMNISGNLATGAITTTGGNFLVRSAQLLADAGYLVVAMDRPSDRPTTGTADVYADTDAYRVSVDQAIDILNVAREVNTDHLPLFLAGNSRGATSVVANNIIANGITLSSAVTLDTVNGRLYLGKPGVANLQPAYVQRRAYFVWHESDACPLSAPSNAQLFFDQMQSAPEKRFFVATLGTRVTTTSTSNGNTVAPDPCGAFDYHGFMGIEPVVMAGIASQISLAYESIFGQGHRVPDVLPYSLTTPAGADITIDLNTISRNHSAGEATFSLPHRKTSLGGSVTLTGPMVTYSPPTGIYNKTDSFAYALSDGRQAVAAAVIQVRIGQ